MPRKKGQVTRQTLWQRKHRAMGLCVVCSEPAYKGWRCVRHYEQHKISMRLRYIPKIRGRYDVGGAAAFLAAARREEARAQKQATAGRSRADEKASVAPERAGKKASVAPERAGKRAKSRRPRADAQPRAAAEGVDAQPRAAAERVDERARVARTTAGKQAPAEASPAGIVPSGVGRRSSRRSRRARGGGGPHD